MRFTIPYLTTAQYIYTDYVKQRIKNAQVYNNCVLKMSQNNDNRVVYDLMIKTRPGAFCLSLWIMGNKSVNGSRYFKIKVLTLLKINFKMSNAGLCEFVLFTESIDTTKINKYENSKYI